MPSVISATFVKRLVVVTNSSWVWYSSDVRKFVVLAYSPLLRPKDDAVQRVVAEDDRSIADLEEHRQLGRHDRSA